MGVRYPVAPTAEAALHAPEGEAERESEARALAGGPVTFATTLVGPAFASAEAALQAVGGRAPALAGALPPWCALQPVAADGARGRPPTEPVFRDGVRWPVADPRAAPAQWRLAVTWWRSAPPEEGEPLGPARTLRRRTDGEALSPAALRRLMDQPLRPARVQRALDMGLFEAPRPEAPGELMPDE